MAKWDTKATKKPSWITWDSLINGSHHRDEATDPVPFIPPQLSLDFLPHIFTIFQRKNLLGGLPAMA